MIWGIGAAAAVVVLGAVLLTATWRARRTRELVVEAIAEMVGSLGAAESSPQRALLESVAETVLAQERAAARIGEMIAGLADAVTGDSPEAVGVLRENDLASDLPKPEEILAELLALPEPQQLIADFIVEYAGASGSDFVFGVIAAEITLEAAGKTYADLAADAPGELKRLRRVASGGVIAEAALAGAALPRRWHAGRSGWAASCLSVPRPADLDSRTAVGVGRALDHATRRQLRLATMLHGQAEAMSSRDRRFRRSGKPFRRLGPAIDSGDLERLAVALDAIGEAVDTAAERLAADDPAGAIYLLSGVRVPVAHGLAGRLFQQGSLAQVRPLATLGAWHRLAVGRWAVSALADLAVGTSGEIASAAARTRVDGAGTISTPPAVEENG